MKKIFLLLCLFFGLNSWADNSFNLNKDGVILDGYDVISYFNSKIPLKGMKNIQVEQDNVIYWFANEENKALFLKDPKKYIPQFGGFCAYAVADSKSKVDVDPNSQDGRLLLFYNGFFGNTKEKWIHTKGKDPREFLKEADQNWTVIKFEEP
jgi:hypothetical protein